MKRIPVIALATLAFACNKVETGGDPKPGKDDVQWLTDGNIETYSEWEGSSVEFVISVPGGRKTEAYSLWSAGDIAGCDPASWKLSGSTDKVTWNQIDAQSDAAFCARYQENLYVLSSAATYSYYKFEMTPREGMVIKLSEIKLHEKNPDALWAGFVYPEVRFEDNAPTTQGSAYYHKMVQDNQAYLRYHVKEVAKLLYSSPSEVPSMSRVTFRLEDFDGVAYASGGSITFSTRHIENSYASSLFKLDYETRGVLFHEVTHVLQLKPLGIPGYQEPNTAWQITEGMADAIRAQSGYLYMSNRKPGGYWQNGYQTTGFFLQWLNGKDPDALRKINGSMRTVNPWSFDGAMAYTFGDGTTTDMLWNEYQAFLNK